MIANDLPPAVRGRMKLWFIEPRPNVFVSGIKDSVADDVTAYLLSKCPPESGVMIFKRTRTTPGFLIQGYGVTDRMITDISGLQLILEKGSIENPIYPKKNG